MKKKFVVSKQCMTNRGLSGIVRFITDGVRGMIANEITEQGKKGDFAGEYYVTFEKVSNE